MRRTNERQEHETEQENEEDKMLLMMKMMLMEVMLLRLRVDILKEKSLEMCDQLEVLLLFVLGLILKRQKEFMQKRCFWSVLVQVEKALEEREREESDREC